MTLILIISTSYSSSNASSVNILGTYDEAKKIVNEVMKSYYLRGPYIQYNNAKATYGQQSPEEATSQETKYDVCAAFICDVYSEAFGVQCGKTLTDFPIYNHYVIDQAENYYNNNKTNNNLDNSFLIYYQNKTDKYIYNDVSSYTSFIKLLQPGDIFAYTGHVMLVYDILTNPDTNKLDVLLMHGTQEPFIYSRSTTTSRLSYNIFERVDSTVNI